MLVVVAILFVVVVLQPDWRTRRQVPRGVKFARGAFDKVASGVGGVGGEVAVAAVVLYKYGGVWLRREVHLARGGIGSWPILNQQSTAAMSFGDSVAGLQVVLRDLAKCELKFTPEVNDNKPDDHYPNLCATPKPV